MPNQSSVGASEQTCVVQMGACGPGLHLTTLAHRPVGTVQQGLVGVPEELIPRHSVDEAQLRVAVDQGHPTAQLPQRAQPQPADAQALHSEGVGATVRGEEGSIVGGSTVDASRHPQQILRKVTCVPGSGVAQSLPPPSPLATHLGFSYPVARSHGPKTHSWRIRPRMTRRFWKTPRSGRVSGHAEMYR